MLFGMLVLCRLASRMVAETGRSGGSDRDGVWNETGLVERFATDQLTWKWRLPVGGRLLRPDGGRRSRASDGPPASNRTEVERVLCFD